MQQAHGIGYEEYSRKLEKRLMVEKRREQNYRKGQFIYSEVDRYTFK
ncbi:hypothetical protein [Salirhabdus sp. Marseille-P4669]|nr:hypothetical protein [Salirhabdus sp. Marseille-P4669]